MSGWTPIKLVEPNPGSFDVFREHHMSITNAETARAQTFAKEVSEAMLRLRGYRDPSEAPRAVRDDVFATITRHQDAYSRAFAGHSSPRKTAEAIQNAEWDGG